MTDKQKLHTALEDAMAEVHLSEERKAAILAAAKGEENVDKKQWTIRTGVIAAALCGVLAVSALAASPTLRQALDGLLGGFEPYAQQVEGISVTDQGIQMTVLRSVADSENGRVYLEIRDLEGDRLTDYTLLDDHIYTEYYDPEERTLLLEVRVSGDMRDEDGNVTLSFSSVQGAEQISAPLPTELLDPDNVLASYECVDQGEKYITEPDGSESERYYLALEPDQTPMDLEGTDRIRLSSMGFDEKGHLHVQVALADGVEEGWIYVEHLRQGERYAGPGTQHRTVLPDGKRVDLCQVPYLESVFLPEDYQGAEARVEGYVFTQPEVEGDWTLTFPLEVLPDRTVTIGQVVNGLNVDTIRLTAMNLYLEGTWNTKSGSLFCPVTLYLKDGTIRQTDRIGMGHVGGMGQEDHSFTNQWTYDDPVEPDQVTAIALGYWYIPLEGGTAQPGHWLQEFPKP